MFKCSRQIKSAFALLLVLAALIIPLYTVAPASAATQSFYGGTLPSNQGGVIVSLDGYISFDLTGVPSSEFFTSYIYLKQGTTTICYVSYTVQGGTKTPGAVPVSFSSGSLIFPNGTQNLAAGRNYVFTYDGISIFSGIHLTITPTWQVNFAASGLDSSTISSNTVVTINGTAVAYSALPNSTFVPDGSVVTFAYSGVVNSTSSSKVFYYSTVNASSPLTVTGPMTVTGTYIPTSTSEIRHLTIKGPYFENGSIANGNSVTFTLLYPNGTTYVKTLTSNATNAGQVDIISLTAFAELTYNATSVSSTFNATRVFTFANGQNGINDSTVYLFILNPTKPAYQYTFSITDFYGMVNPYLQSSLSPSGNNTQVVERVNLKDGGGFVTFVMQQYQLYTLTFICQQGTYSQTFTPTLLGAPGQNPVSLSILAGNFPSSNLTSGITYSANRTGDSSIMASYLDASGNTTSVNVQIIHTSGSQTIVDYNSTGVGSSQVFSWSQASNNVNYNVEFTAVANGVTSTYWVAIPSAVGNNPWAQVDWSNLGKYIPTLPATYTGWGGLDPNQIMAVFLILAALGIGSYFSTGASCLICWVMAGILYAMGWWQCGLPMFAFAGVLTAFILVDEYKKGAFNL